jgi:ribosomal protein L17
LTKEKKFLYNNIVKIKDENFRMKKKELKNLAAKIAKYEKIVQTSEDSKAVKRAEEEIMKLSSCVDSLEDMTAIDELVMEILEKN